MRGGGGVGRFERDYMMKRGSDLIIGLDIGTSTVRTVVAEDDRDADSLKIIGTGTAPSEGIKKGIVIDMEGVSNSISRSIEDAEKTANVEINSVFAGVGGGEIRGCNSKGVAAVDAHEEVTEKDVARAIDAARAVSLPVEREIIHAIPRQFILDGHEGIRDAVGMSGVRLEAEVHLITGAVTAVQNIVKSINRAGLEVEDIVFDAVAGSLTVLSDDDKESGVLLIDLGGGKTTCLLFHRGAIAYSDVLPLGGDHVTNDISVALHVPLSAAGELKRTGGNALEGNIDPSEEVSIPGVAERRAARYSKRELARVIEYRLTEIFGVVKKRIANAGFRRMAGAGVILTGGGASLEGVAACAESLFDLPVRMGIPLNIAGLIELVANPEYATGVGVARYGYDCRRGGHVSRFRKRSLWGRMGKRIRALAGK